jgi:hypothetical protein
VKKYFFAGKGGMAECFDSAQHERRKGMKVENPYAIPPVVNK